MSTKPFRNKELKKVLIQLKGDSESISKLIQTMSGRLYDEAFRYLGDHHEAVDAVSHTLSRLWEKAGGYAEERPAMPYVLSVLRNRCRDVLRSRNKKHKTVNIDSIPEPNYTACQYTVEFMIDSDLSGWDWEVAKKLCLDKMSLTEVQKEMNLSPTQISQVIESIRETLAF